MSDKEIYRKLCQTEPSIPTFSKDWWLDAVCGEDNWDVAVIEKGGIVVGSIPFYKKEAYGLLIITMPALTQNMGTWIKYPTGQKVTTKLGYEKDIMLELIDRLPHFNFFNQNFHYSITNWLPFYWKGFNQTTQYTYVIEDLNNLEDIFTGFRENIKTDIRKALKKVKTHQTEELDKFYQINKMTFERQSLSIPYSLELIRRLDKACVERKCRKIFFAQDEKGNIHASVYIVWDDNSAYYLMGGGDPKFRNSGATSLLMWEAIQFASTVTKKFDFEGSMIESVERFFRAFGAVQKPYFNITKINSKMMKIRRCLMEIFK